MNAGSVKYIKRPVYLEKVTSFINKDIIKVFVGQRRVGKSYMLYQVMDKILETDPDAKLVYINKELDEFSGIVNYKDLLKYIEMQYTKDQRKYIFIDEIQDITDFEKALRSMQAKGNCDIYCTGSNAIMLSGELATYLSGRYIEIKVFSLSFREFLEFHRLKNTNDSFLKYLKVGGLPYLIHLPLEESIVYDYLKNIYATILFKDVVKRFGIRNIQFLENLVRFLADNCGSLVSSKKISDYLKSQKINISPQVVLNYIYYLESAFMIFKVRRSELAGKKIFESGEKYYFEDLGLRNSIVGYKLTDINKILENAVYLHLIIAGYNVRVGISGEKEIDFICERTGEKLYVQVCYLLSGEKVIKREFENLLEVKDNYPKYVVSMDEVSGTSSYKGIKQMHIRDFVLMIIQ